MTDINIEDLKKTKKELEGVKKDVDKRLDHINTLIEEQSAPKVDKDPDLTDLISLCEEYIQWYSSDEYHEDSNVDYLHYFYEQVLKTFFGGNVFDWLNDVDDKREY